MKFREFIDKYAKTYMIACMIILLGVVGITYAYYAATVSNTTAVTGQAGGGVAPTLSVDLVSDTATGNLIPIDMNTDILTKAASASTKCIDNNGYSVCQIYSVTVTNNSDLAQSYYITLSNLYGENTPNIDAVSMGTSDSAVTDATSIKGTGNICTTNSVGKGVTTNACYFMVVIKNLDDVQTDNGTFGGTVTATSTTGSEVKADFGEVLEVTPISDFEYAIDTVYNGVSGEDVTIPSSYVVLTSYKGAGSDVVIPATYTIEGTTYQTVVHKMSMVYESAFTYNNVIETITLLEGVKVGTMHEGEPLYQIITSASGLFANVPGLKSVVGIPDNITEMNYMFAWSENLTGVIRINSTNVTSADSAFEGTVLPITLEVPAGSTTYTTLSNSDLPSNVTLTTFTP